MANNGIFINIAMVLWAANITAVSDKEGKPIIPDTFEAVNGGLAMSVLSEFLTLGDRNDRSALC